ncbi:hypothetical protein [Jiangella alkaliphila]|uniref:Prenyltransferase and squalene oxidase repeat-containing protein n=1 Tax=Jiangella alkaliphila TaxID=419479 RepID=A0A1H2G0A6_9ACTN|nr:hypothetical protein [Jiangella alkaliphila]SDU13031.1 hypothetical protein SAMN04488563_0220 [Jiangella alkaliphila]
MDLTAASAFMAGHSRQLDRLRLGLVSGTGDRTATLAALAGYRNPDGGFGWGLEPDLRSPESQPPAALHAFEVLAETGPGDGGLAGPLCDWLASVTLPDGGVPFALPVTVPEGTSHWWIGADASESSLQITSAVAGQAHRAARLDPVIAGHPWLDRATEFCLTTIAATERPRAHELMFSLGFLDAVHDSRPEAAAELERLGRLVPSDGGIPVEGGIEGEAMHLLDLSPEPGRPLRALLDPDAVERDLDRLAALQQDDGGWVVDFDSSSAAGALEWRGYQTVWAVRTLLAHGRR